MLATLQKKGPLQVREENMLLAALPETERERLSPYLKKVRLDFQQVLVEPHQEIADIYFPYNAITSTVHEMSDGTSVETGLMGLEGFVGVQLWLHSRTTPSRTFVQVAGESHHMRASDFIRHVRDTDSPLNELCAKYVHAFLVMTSQTAACNRLHPLNERLCRWLKLVHNRLRRDEFPMRQEFMAMMLGVQRPTVSTAANMLQQAGLIRYSRGQMRILNAEGLRNGSCECLELIEKQFEQIFDRYHG
ncbi:MAG TPA: Crp/Fnr family transcriptional regulator [Pyrinomonadaceae bacterium]|nr:Crp/Fnr family transcriptional regulator [Pyrinomonadaceae bacterium]